MTNAILRGKPDAGNPHVRFDEGEVASAKPRRGSLLYKFYKCDVCGKIVAMVKETPVETVCCGRPMRALVPGETDGAAEKHVPVCAETDGAVTVTVGSAAHPMAAEHFIEWIAIETANGNQRKELKPGDSPRATFALVPSDTVKAAYAYCNLHGLWRA